MCHPHGVLSQYQDGVIFHLYLVTQDYTELRIHYKWLLSLSATIKWSDGEKRQEEEAEVVAATQKRKMLCKTRRGNLVIKVCRSLFLF